MASVTDESRQSGYNIFTNPRKIKNPREKRKDMLLTIFSSFLVTKTRGSKKSIISLYSELTPLTSGRRNDIKQRKILLKRSVKCDYNEISTNNSEKSSQYQISHGKIFVTKANL